MCLEEEGPPGPLSRPESQLLFEQNVERLKIFPHLSFAFTPVCPIEICLISARLERKSSSNVRRYLDTRLGHIGRAENGDLGARLLLLLHLNSLTKSDPFQLILIFELEISPE